MPGIFDRIKPAAENGDRVSAHLLKAAIFLGSDAVFTDQQIVDGLNARFATPLDAAAVTDLAKIRAAVTNAATVQAGLRILERFDALNIAVEMGVLTSEATYRSKLGI